MIYESRIYKAVPGKLPAINARFANHTIGFFEEFNIGMMGFWNDEIGASNQLTYILSFDSMACLLYTSPSPRDATLSRMPSSA